MSSSVPPVVHPPAAAPPPDIVLLEGPRARIRELGTVVWAGRDFIRGFERRVNDDGDSHWEVLLTGVTESLPVSRRQQFVVRDVGRETAA